MKIYTLHLQTFYKLWVFHFKHIVKVVFICAQVDNWLKLLKINPHLESSIFFCYYAKALLGSKGEKK